MARTLKIYDYTPPADAAAQAVKIIETYPAFVLAEVGENAVEGLKRSHLVEDVTDQYELPAGSTSIDTTKPRINAQGKTMPHPAYRAAATLKPGPHHYIVQFIGPIKNAWLTKTRKAGAELVEPYGSFSYVARLTSKAVTSVSKLPFVRWLGHLPYRARVSESLQAGGRKGAAIPEAPRTRLRAGVYTVQFFLPKQAAGARAAVRKLGFEILSDESDSGLLIVRSAETRAAGIAKEIDALSRVHGVSQITERAVRRRTNDRAAAVMGAAATLGNPGLKLSGEGEIIAVADTGLDTGNPANIHPDFAGRVAFIKSYPITPDYKQFISNFGVDDGAGDLDSGHGTHTAGSVLGDGKSSANLTGLVGPVRGLSYKARLVFQAIEQEMKWKNPADLKFGRFLLSGIPADLTTLFGDAYAKGARIHSNSWGGGNPGEYDEQCRQLDEFVWKKPDLCILFAAGNDGTDRNKDGVVDFGSVTSPGTAKNCITVGACENNRPDMTMTYGASWPDDYPAEPIKSDRVANNVDDVVAFSSRGPTQDGRIKPDIVAPGTFILSTRSRMIAENLFGWGRFSPSKLYMYDGGTSMATPLTAGAVGTVREYLRKQRGIASPTAALLKAALVAGATYMRGPGNGFDNHQGFGRINLDAILIPPVPLKTQFVEAPGMKTGDMTERTVQVAAGGSPLRIVLAYSDFPGPRLVNNLNLVVRTPSGAVLVGNAKAPSGSFDTSNNVELVHIAQAAAGAYRVQVVGSNVSRGPQPFALVLRGAFA